MFPNGSINRLLRRAQTGPTQTTFWSQFGRRVSHMSCKLESIGPLCSDNKVETHRWLHELMHSPSDGKIHIMQSLEDPCALMKTQNAVSA